jgi:hypothetical protein
MYFELLFSLRRCNQCSRTDLRRIGNHLNMLENMPVFLQGGENKLAIAIYASQGTSKA